MRYSLDQIMVLIKSKNCFLLLMCLLVFQCCTPPVQFGEPQPTGENNLDAFPDKLQGQFLNVADSSVLTIGKDLMVQHYHSLIAESRKDLDTLYKLVNDSTIVNRDTNDSTRVMVTADTVRGYIDVYDTLFHISEKNVLRKFKGYYFLNVAYSESWEVQMLNLSNQKLSLGKIPSKEGMEKIKSISEAAVDTSKGNVELTKDEFKEFIKQGGFYITSEFVRVK